MSSAVPDGEQPAKLPCAKVGQVYVTVHALLAGSLTLPEYQFVQPSVEGRRHTVPSLSFLIQHREPTSGKITRIVFDLGIRRDTNKYPEALQRHLLNRQPLSTDPDVKASIEAGGLSLEDVHYVILSHVHWDHVGTPSDFSKSHFIVGNGSLELLDSGSREARSGGHAHFEPDLLPPERTTQLPNPEQSTIVPEEGRRRRNLPAALSHATWAPLAHLPHVIDVFKDGSLFIADAPGHLQGHINLLARLGPKRWAYLGGDACHDRRLLNRELEVAEWQGEDGQTCCIHGDKRRTIETLERIKTLELMEDQHVEVILAHDAAWASTERNRHRFWPGTL